MNNITFEVLSTSMGYTQKLTKSGMYFIDDGETPPYYRSRVSGKFSPPRGTKIEILGYSMPMRSASYCVKLKFDCRDAVTNLGVINLFTSVPTLEAMDLEPLQ